MTRGDLRAGLLTAPGEGGISVIALEGVGARALVEERLRGPLGERRVPAAGKLAYGRFCDAFGELLDEVIVACARVGRFEINCHGGALPARRVLRSLEAAGAELLGYAKAADFRPAAGGIEREAAAALRNAFTDLGARVLAAQLGGALRRDLQAALDALDRDGEGLQAALQILDRLVSAAPAGLALVTPVPVAVVGPVNAGKSTLVNAIAGFSRTIVSDVAGTTRDAVGVPVSILGLPVMLYDTAGAGTERDALDAEAARRRRETSLRSRVAVVVVDVSAPLPGGFAPDRSAGAIVVAANKSDLPAVPATLAAARAWGAPLVTTSGASGKGLGELSGAILEAAGVPVPLNDLAAGGVIFSGEQQRAAAAAGAAVGRADRAAAREWLLGILRA